MGKSLIPLDSAYGRVISNLELYTDGELNQLFAEVWYAILDRETEEEIRKNANKVEKG